MENQCKSIGEIIKAYKDSHQNILPKCECYHFENARGKINYFFQRFLAEEYKVFQDHKEYDKVAEWLEDTKGKGLFLYGKCGTGKTMLARKIIPSIFKEKNKWFNIYEAYEMKDKFKEILALSCHNFVLDDIGVEGTLNDFNKEEKFLPKIMDSVEKNGKLIIITTNLDGDDFLEKYGERTWERLKATTKPILFNFESMR